MMTTIRRAALICVAAALSACGGGSALGTPDAAVFAEGALGTPERVATFDRMPSGIAVYGDRVFVAFPRWVEPGACTVSEVVEGQPVPYPTAGLNAGAPQDTLVSVNGLRADGRGWLWMLDNGRVDLLPAERGAPKLIVWDTVQEREVFRHAFAEDIAPAAASFLNDLVVDERHGFAYVADTGIGGTPAIIVFDVLRDTARRVLAGHASVTPEEVGVFIDGAQVELTRPDGTTAAWRVAVNTIGLSPEGEWLYYGPLSGRTLYRVPTSALRDATLDPAEVAARVESFAPKPLSDGMAVADDGRLFVTDVERGAVVLVRPAAPVAPVVRHVALEFPVAVEATSDALWITSNQLHRAPLLHAGRDDRTPPYLLWRAPLPSLAP